MKALQLSVFVACVVLASAVANAESLGSIGVSFGADAAGGGDPVLQPTDVAGVVPQENWNNASGTGDTLTDLLDNSGAATTAVVTWAADESWSWNTPIATADAKLMSGWISENSGTGEASTVSISEIPYETYNLYIYAGHDRIDNTPQFAETSAAFPTFSVTENITPDLLGADPFVYTESVGGGAGNYVLVRGLTASALDIELSNASNDRAGFAGFQIVEIPEPTSIVLLGGLGVALITVARRRG